MKIILDTKRYLIMSKEDQLTLSNLFQDILKNQSILETIIQKQQRSFPLDEWILYKTFDIHFFLQSDGSRRSRRVIHIYPINKHHPENTNIDYFIEVKPSKSKLIKRIS